MRSIEDQIRDSLRQRAGDVEPTPALWAEVDRRIARRRRRTVVSWSLAAAAAVVAAVLVVPALVTGPAPGDLEIEPIGPASGAVPSLAVIADGGTVSLVDLRGGDEVTTLFEGDGEVAQVEVRPGSTREDYDVAVVRIGDDEVAEVLLAHAVDGVPDAVEGRLESHAVAPGFVPTVAWAPEGRTLLYSVPVDERAQLVAEDMAEVDGTYLDPDRGSRVAQIDRDATVVDWVGEVTGPGATSEVVVRRADGRVLALEIETDPEGRVPQDQAVPSADTWRGFTDVLDLAAAHEVTSPAEDAVFALDARAEGALQLRWSSGDGEELVDVILPDAFATDAVGDPWLAARGDAAIVGDGSGMWLLSHDGSGTFAPPVEVADGVGIGALFDVRRAPVSDEEPSPDGDTPDPAPDPTDGAEGDDAPAEGEGAAPVLTEPVVTASAQELTLLGPDGPVVVASLAAEGESRFVSARVRPGSTPDDLTVVALTTAEGMYDLRHLHYVDGEVATFEAFDAPYTPGFGGTAGAGVSVWGPVWSPDGAQLAWFEYGTGPATLRTIGWDDGPGTGLTATDNATFDLPSGGVEPLVPMEWVEVPGDPGATEIRATASGSNAGWYALPVTIQGDGAVSLPDTEFLVRPAPETEEGSVAAVAGVLGPEAVAWMVVMTPDAAALLQDPSADATRTDLPGVMPSGDELPTFYVREVGADALVGGPGTGALLLVTSEGDVEEIGEAILDTDVVD